VEGGNLKYDFAAQPAPAGSPALAFIDGLRPARVWIAASTMPPAEPGDVDEDDVVVSAYRELSAKVRDLVLILVPRKPERFEEAARKLEMAGIPYTRRTALAEGAAGSGRVLLLDTIGELSGLFAAADVVFMGGSLARRGGHNILEPALFGKPVIRGPHMENFQAIADEFREAGAAIEIGGPEALADAVGRLIEDRAAARETGARAQACAEQRRGAVARAVTEIRRLHSAGVPQYRPAVPWYWMAWALSRVWIAGARRRRRKALASRRHLGAPVISIGNITMGGTGKTPCVLLAAELLRDRGKRPGILTRGYGRSSSERQLVIAPGASVKVESSGDEPQIFVRSGLAPVGIGGDRYAAGRLLLQQFEIDVFLLDDGFQHERLSRDLDVVLVDALEPFGRGEVFPLGRLREPLTGLERADVVLVTRSDLSDLAPAVEKVIRRVNSSAPIFRAGVRPHAWVEHAAGTRYAADAAPFGKAAAFCGLGNPDAFRRTLQRLGVPPAEWVVFEDHHRYRPHELKRIAEQSIARGATALVTTEKDVVNLCEGWRDLLKPLPLYWLEVKMQVERQEEFARELERHLFDGAPRGASSAPRN
jgi:tetraacyldisaccharide 4'-kinase